MDRSMIAHRIVTRIVPENCMAVPTMIDSELSTLKLSGPFRRTIAAAPTGIGRNGRSCKYGTTGTDVKRSILFGVANAECANECGRPCSLPACLRLAIMTCAGGNAVTFRCGPRMAIAFSCPQCGKEYKVKDELAGKPVTCKVCTAPIR